MSAVIERRTIRPAAIDQLWYTRCNVPTASGIAFNLGWLAERYARDGVGIEALQDAPLSIAQHHYDHQLPGLIREGGNVPAIVAKSQGSPTRLIGLTWIDERQAIVARPEGGIRDAKDLRGARIAVPALTDRAETNMARAMALHGFENALGLAGLTLDDVSRLEIQLGEIVPPGQHREKQGKESWPGLKAVAEGRADALYIKGAAANAEARRLGLVIAVDLDTTASKFGRVNNGTPRPLTIHRDLLESRPEWIIDFLALTLKAARWASENPQATRDVVARETKAPIDFLDSAYGGEFHLGLAPDLSDERLKLLEQQKHFLLRQGFISKNFSIVAWSVPELIESAIRRSQTGV